MAEPARRPLERLRELLQREAGASGGGCFLILTHRSPDPDALGACCGLRHLLENGFGMDTRVATVGRIQRAENVAMVRELALSFEDYHKVDLEGVTGTLLVDSQPGFGHTELPGGLPLLAVFDHHETPEAVRDALAAVPHVDVRPDVGATSSIVYEYLRDARLELDQHTASALFCGIRFDTADLSHHLSRLDEEAYFATLRRADRPLVARIQRPTLPIDYYRELDRALRSARKHGALVVGLFGEVPNPESVAEMADFFLRMDGVSVTFAGGAHGGVYFVSLRTAVGFTPAYPLLEELLDERGSFGGHGRIAGGQIDLDGGGASAIKKLQRELRERALAVFEDRLAMSEDERTGKPLV